MRVATIGLAARVLGVVCLSAALAACGGGAPSASQAGAQSEHSAKSDARELEIYLARSCERSKEHRAVDVSPGSGQGSSVALVRDGSRSIAYVADHDRARVVVVDVDDGSVVGETHLLGAPEQVLVLRDGRIVVSLGDRSHVEVLEPGPSSDAPLVRLCARKVPAGPFGLAASPDGEVVVVTSAWDASITALSAATFENKGSSHLPRAPRGVLVDRSGSAFISHLVGARLSVVDLGEHTGPARSLNLALRAGSAAAAESELDAVRSGGQAYALVSVDVRPQDAPRAENARPLPKGAGLNHAAPRAPAQPPPPSGARIIVPMVSVDPGSPDRPRSSYYGSSSIAGVGRMFPSAVVVDPAIEQSLSTRAIATTGGQRSVECVLPRAAATFGQKVYVACVGIDQLLELDGRTADPLRAPMRRFNVPAGPTGVAIDERGARAVVFAQLADTLAVVPLDGSKVKTIALGGGAPALSEAALRGRMIFYRSDDARITSEGLACSSCHPDGTEDGLTWSTPEGGRQTPMLAGRLRKTAPFGWTRGKTTLTSYVADTCARLGGSGLASGDLSDLAVFLEELPSPPAGHAESEDAIRGEEIFESRGCGACHVGGVGTDARNHNFEGAGEPVDTPSLRDVGKTAPYFHDGRYPTLEALLSDRYSMMGAVSHLTGEERVFLQRYLESL